MFKRGRLTTALTLVAALMPQIASAAPSSGFLGKTIINDDLQFSGSEAIMFGKQKPAAIQSANNELSVTAKADWQFCVNGTLIETEMPYKISGTGISTSPDSISKITAAAKAALSRIKANSNMGMIEASIDTMDEIKATMASARQPIAQDIFNYVVTALNEEDLLLVAPEDARLYVENYGTNVMRATKQSRECGAGGQQNASLMHLTAI